MTSIGVQNTQYFVENRSWLLGEHGTDPGATPGVTLDVSTFNAATHFPNGFIPSGIALGIITAASADTKLVVGPYDDTATDGRQVCAGYLFSTVTVPNPADTTKDVGGALFCHGFVRTSRLPIANGAAGGGFIDANGKTDLKLIHHV